MVAVNNYKYIFSLLYEMKVFPVAPLSNQEKLRMVPCISTPLVRFFFCDKIKGDVIYD